MLKRPLTYLLAVALVFSLAACGNRDQNGGDTGNRISAVSDEYKLGMDLLDEEKYEEAVTAFTNSIAKEPDSDESHIGRGDAYTGLEKAEEALSDYQTALGLYESEAAYLGAVNAYILMNDFDAALQMATDGSKAVKSDALDTKRAALEKGNAEDSLGREHKATRYDDKGEIIWVHITEYSGGRISVMTSYDKSGMQVGRYEYAYDQSGNCVKSCWFVWDRADLMPREEVYDGQNRVTQIINYGIGSMATNKTVIEYGADGSRLKSTYWPIIENTADYNYSLYEWTDFGKLSVMRTYDNNDELTGRRVYEYDDKQQHIKETWYNPDGSLYFYYTYEYDASGKRICENRYDENGKLVSTTEY